MTTLSQSNNVTVPNQTGDASVASQADDAAVSSQPDDATIPGQPDDATVPGQPDDASIPCHSISFYFATPLGYLREFSYALLCFVLPSAHNLNSTAVLCLCIRTRNTKCHLHQAALNLAGAISFKSKMLNLFKGFTTRE